MVSNACTELLEQGRRFGPLYGPRLANHLPMALIALDRLGADGATMQAFAEGYSKKLRLLVDEPGVADPRDCLGTGQHFPQLVRHFRQRVDADGLDAVMREWVPLLVPGLAASAFHAMIRLAYAIDAGDEAEAVHALAYWVVDYVPMPLSMNATDAAPAGIAARLAAAVEGHVFGPGIIIDRMLEIARHPAVAAAATQPRQISLRDAAQFALAAYSEREDFTLLHTVTGCHAFRLLLPWAGDEERALRYLWQAVLMAYLAVEQRSASAAPPIPQLSEAEIAARARDSRDDHVIKLCYSALCEYRTWGDERYLRAARRKVGS
jgi:hypothetical protein